MRSGIVVLGAILVMGVSVSAAPKPLPSLAKINGWLDQAREKEWKSDYRGVPELYAKVIAECGSPVPHHLIHVAARATRTRR